MQVQLPKNDFELSFLDESFAAKKALHASSSMITYKHDISPVNKSSSFLFSSQQDPLQREKLKVLAELADPRIATYLLEHETAMVRDKANLHCSNFVDMFNRESGKDTFEVVHEESGLSVALSNAGSFID